jgi:multiple sugar transport system permease protein
VIAASATTRARRGRIGVAVSRAWPAFLFLLPAALGLLLFRFWPVLAAIDNSAYDVNLISARRTFVGLNNYLRALQDGELLTSVRNTIVFTAVKVPLQTVLALGLALLVNRAGRAILVVRTAVFLPVVTSLVVASTLWLLLLQPDQGLVNGLLSTLGLPRQPFLRDVGQALPSIIAMTTWKDVGLSMLFFLAGLQSIPEIYYEAARIDGAGAWHRFRHVTLPLLRGTLLFVLITETVFALRVFAPVYVTTQGGPRQATSVVVFHIYEQAFPLNSVGYASALSVLLLAFILFVTVLLRRLVGARVAY